MQIQIVQVQIQVIQLQIQLIQVQMQIHFKDMQVRIQEILLTYHQYQSYKYKLVLYKCDAVDGEEGQVST